VLHPQGTLVSYVEQLTCNDLINGREAHSVQNGGDLWWHVVENFPVVPAGLCDGGGFTAVFDEWVTTTDPDFPCSLSRPKTSTRPCESLERDSATGAWVHHNSTQCTRSECEEHWLTDSTYRRYGSHPDISAEMTVHEVIALHLAGDDRGNDPDTFYDYYYWTYQEGYDFYQEQTFLRSDFYFTLKQMGEACCACGGGIS
jgi:hypothetical protein